MKGGHILLIKRQSKFISLQYKVLFYSIILIIIPLVSVGAISYVKSSQIIQHKVSISNLHTVSQVGNNIEYILQDIHDISLYIIQNDEIRDFLKLSNESDEKTIREKKITLDRTLMYLVSSKKYINSIYIKGFNGVTLDTKGIVNQLDSETVEKIHELKGAYIWIYNKITGYDNVTIDAISLVRILRDINNINSNLGILKINIDEKAIADIYRDKVIGNGDFMIVDENDRIISAINKNKLNQKAIPAISDFDFYNNKEGYFETTIDNKGYLVTYYNIDNLNWRVINFIPIEEILSENAIIKDVVLVAIIICFAICTVMAFLFSVKFLKPLKLLCAKMKKVENEDFDVYMEAKSNDEISMLINSFNKMSNKLKELINQVYAVQIKQRESELKALQAQINPHFLYNTLDTIYWMGRIEKAFDTCKLVEALARLFRLSLNRGEEITTVNNEVENLRSYVVIQQKRYENMINFSIDVDENTLNYKTVKLILQPLVENAIYHGIEKKGGRGNISVQIKEEENKLLYCVIDDGCGVNTEKIKALLSQSDTQIKGFGIKNVNDRIKLYFGEEFGIEFYSSYEQGTKVMVYQPAIKDVV
jgi:two-component system sensor histidine kinase YesM